MNKILQSRREILLKFMKHDSLLILGAGNEIKKSEDSNYDFFVNRHFFYVSNISQENSIFVLQKNTKKSLIFVDPYDSRKETWFGKRLSLQEAKNISDVTQSLDVTKFVDYLKKFSQKTRIVYYDRKCSDPRILEFKKISKKIKFIDISDFISSMRLIKDSDEINNIKNAIANTNTGLKSLIKFAKKCNYEYELYNYFNYSILNLGTHEIGFPSIIATGVNTCCLHYPNPTEKIKKDGLLLCDVGSAFNHYSADVTRTYPLSGKFSPFQKKVYEIVLGCNKELIAMVKPGLTNADLQDFAINYLASSCLKAGIIKKKSDISKYYMHNVSHSLGLDVHDVGGFRSSDKVKLKPGMIITIEPGLYIKEKSTGVRIEDDVLVTEDGGICLSKDVAKEICDIENFMR